MRYINQLFIIIIIIFLIIQLFWWIAGYTRFNIIKLIFKNEKKKGLNFSYNVLFLFKV